MKEILPCHLTGEQFVSLNDSRSCGVWANRNDQTLKRNKLFPHMIRLILCFQPYGCSDQKV